MEMDIEIGTTNSVAVVRVRGNITGGPDSDELRSTLLQLADDGKLDILLNLSEVGWINSVGVGIVLASYASLTKRGGRFKVACFNERVGSMFQTVRIRQIIETFDSEEKALASFSGPSG